MPTLYPTTYCMIYSNHYYLLVCHRVQKSDFSMKTE